VGGYDLVLAKLDSSGDTVWTRIFSGGATEDRGYSVIQTSFGGIVAVGATYSFGAGSSDILLARFDVDGNTCLGEFVSPEFDSISPDTSSPDPIVTTWSPIITSPNPSVTSPDPTLTVVCDETVPSIISVTDVGNDQGRQVRVKWERCYYDNAGSPIMITEYSLWRRIDQDKSNSRSDEMRLSDVGMFRGTRLYPPGDWDFIKTVPARGEEEYSTICPTLGDSTKREGMYWSFFFVSAMTADPLVYFDSDPDSGYSLDNIPPMPIRDMEINPSSWFTLEWTVPGEYVGEQPISAYDIRYNTVPVGADTQTWWDDAVSCTGDGFFNFVVGERDSLQVADEARYHPEIYLAIKGLDERPNASGISDIVDFICADANASGMVEPGDIVYLITYLFRGGPAPQPMAIGDVNCSGLVEAGDIVYLIGYLFRDGQAPCGP
jgi:hypothetical protein